MAIARVAQNLRADTLRCLFKARMEWASEGRFDHYLIDTVRQRSECKLSVHGKTGVREITPDSPIIFDSHSLRSVELQAMKRKLAKGLGTLIDAT